LKDIFRVATQSGNQGKQGKWPKQIPCREKSEFQNFKKIRELSGNFTIVKKRNESTGSFSS